MPPDTGNRWFARILPDLLAFALGLSVAYYLEWDTTDLVWSLWLCSLVLGYLTLLSAIGSRAYLSLHMTRHEGFPGTQRASTGLIGMAAGLFFLGFLSLHFCGFHAGPMPK
ncbi:MAG: DUF6498-containing protein [Chromatocurvus sp.]